MGLVLSRPDQFSEVSQVKIGAGTFGVRGYSAFGTTKATPTTPKGPGRDALRIQLQRVDDEIGDLRKVLKSIRSRGGKARAPGVLGSVSGLGLTTFKAKLTSASEVNTESTRLSSRTPQWTGNGGRDVTVGGVYSGATDDTLTFTAKAIPLLPLGGTQKVDVRNSAGNLVGTYDMNATNQSTTVDLGNGLSVTFAAGTKLDTGDTFSIDMFASQDGAINRANAFGGIGTASAGFAEGTTITNGSFTVNGVSISVSTTDSLDDVLGRINSLVSGVEASYDEATEKVLLQTSVGGADQSVEIAGDTSGLIAALKLDGQGKKNGSDGDLDRLLADIPGFDGVTAGTFTINGQDVAIDPDTQTLSDLVAALNAVDGVTAQLDPLGRMVLKGTAGEPLTLVDQGTGLADALGIQLGVHKGKTGGRQKVSDLAARRISSELIELREALDALVDNAGLTGLVADMRTDIGVAVEVALRDADGVDGIASLIKLDNFKNDRVASAGRTAQQVRTSYTDVRALFLGQTGSKKEGLLDQLDDIVRRGLSKVDRVDVKV